MNSRVSRWIVKVGPTRKYIMRKSPLHCQEFSEDCCLGSRDPKFWVRRTLLEVSSQSWILRHEAIISQESFFLPHRVTLSHNLEALEDMTMQYMYRFYISNICKHYSTMRTSNWWYNFSQMIQLAKHLYNSQYSAHSYWFAWMFISYIRCFYCSSVITEISRWLRPQVINGCCGSHHRECFIKAWIIEHGGVG